MLKRGQQLRGMGGRNYNKVEAALMWGMGRGVVEIILKKS